MTSEMETELDTYENSRYWYELVYETMINKNNVATINKGFKTEQINKQYDNRPYSSTSLKTN